MVPPTAAGLPIHVPGVNLLEGALLASLDMLSPIYRGVAAASDPFLELPRSDLAFAHAPPVSRPRGTRCTGSHGALSPLFMVSARGPARPDCVRRTVSRS